jgi:hypothetical protein
MLNLSKTMISVAVTAACLSAFTASFALAQAAGRASDRDVIELTADNFCRSQNSRPDVREMMDRLRISVASYCQCVVTEVSYSMDRTQAGADWVNFVYRSHGSGNSPPQDDRERAAETTFKNTMSLANRRCAARLAP